MKEKELYLKLKRSVKVTKKTIKLKDISTVCSSDSSLQKAAEDTIIYVFDKTPEKNKEIIYVVSITDILSILFKSFPDTKVENIGEKDTIISYKISQDSKAVRTLKVFFICLVIFAGSAFTIMTFNEDVSVKEIISLIYRLLGHEEAQSRGLFEISYSIGLPVGIILFFNHFSKIKLSEDPTPLQVQMSIYSKDSDATIVEKQEQSKDDQKS